MSRGRRPRARSELGAIAVAAAAFVAGAASLQAQDLAPRAYLITPPRSNAFTLGHNYNDGELLFAGTVPVTASYAQGAYIRFGGDYRIFSLAWQCAWIDSPR